MTTKQVATDLVRQYELLVPYWDCYNDTMLEEEEILDNAKNVHL